MARIILDVSMGDTAAKPPFFSTGIIHFVNSRTAEASHVLLDSGIKFVFSQCIVSI